MIVDMVVNPKQAVGLLAGYGERAGDMRPALGLIRELMVKGHEANFQSQGRFLGAAWPPLSEETLARKSREGLSSEPMVGAGALRTALSGGRGKVSRVTRTSARAGTSVFYARFHQAGAGGKRRGEMPKRPLVGMGEAEFQASLSIIQRFLEHGG